MPKYDVDVQSVSDVLFVRIEKIYSTTNKVAFITNFNPKITLIQEVIKRALDYFYSIENIENIEVESYKKRIESLLNKTEDCHGK